MRWALAFIALTLATTDVMADGCFVLPPFAWNRFRDINEPTQKAILLYDASREDMILQVRYEGPVTEFGWLIPVPSEPKIAAASMASFYELSRFTQEEIYRRRSRTRTAYAGPLDSPAPVAVLEYRTVGAYDVAVLTAQSSTNLTSWLLSNHFAVRRGAQQVLQSYVDRHWFFVAIRVHLLENGGQIGRPAGTSPSTETNRVLNSAQALRLGELHPLKISFDSTNCIFPLKISSANGRASEVLLYVLSPEPLTCGALVKPVHRPATMGGGNYDLPGELDWSFCAGALTADRLPKCQDDLPRLAGRNWTWVEFRKVFRPEEMEDLVFESMFPVLRANLNTWASYEARSRLSSFNELSKPLWPDLAASSLVENRIECCALLHAYPDRDSVNLVLKLLDDVPVRSQACWAAERYNDSRVVYKLLDLLSSHDSLARRNVALACGELDVRDSRVIEALIEVLDDPYPIPQQRAQSLLQDLTSQNLTGREQWREWWVKQTR